MFGEFITVSIYNERTGEALEFWNVQETETCYGNALKHKMLRKARRLGFLEKGDKYRVEMWAE